MKWKRHLVLTSIILFCFISLAYAPSGNKWTTTCRFHLSTPNTYIYLGDTVYADYTYLYNNRLSFTNVYMGAGVTVSSFSIEVTNADLTLNTLMAGDEVKVSVTASSGVISTTVLGFPSKPKWAKIDSITRLEGDMWTWSDATSKATVTITHSSTSIIQFYWSEIPSEPSSPSSPSGPSPPPEEPEEPVITLPPSNVTVPAIPWVPPPPERPWYLIPFGIIVIVVLIGGAFLYKDIQKASRLNWPSSKRKNPSWPKNEGVTVEWKQKKPISIEFPKKKRKNPKWNKRKRLDEL